jgi:NH3-dependent NAD+ synthetase
MLLMKFRILTKTACCLKGVAEENIQARVRGVYLMAFANQATICR